MQIEQIQTQYQSTEDRILLLIKTDQMLLQYYLTRRYLKLLIRSLLELMELSLPMIPDKSSKQLALAFEHEKIADKFEYNKGVNEEKTPLPKVNDAPLLYSVTVKSHPEAQWRILCLYDKNGQGIELPAQHEILHLLYKLLIDCVKTADWQLNVDALNLESTANVAPNRLN